MGAGEGGIQGRKHGRQGEFALTKKSNSEQGHDSGETEKKRGDTVVPDGARASSSIRLKGEERQGRGGGKNRSEPESGRQLARDSPENAIKRGA